MCTKVSNDQMNWIDALASGERPRPSLSTNSAFARPWKRQRQYSMQDELKSTPI